MSSGWAWQSGIHAPTTFVPGVTIFRTGGHDWVPSMKTTMAGWTWLFAQNLLNRPFSSGIVVDNFDPTANSTGTWNLSTSDGPYLGNVRLATGGSGGTFSLPAEIPSNGSYRVYLRWTTPAANPTGTRSNVVPVDIVHAGGTTTVTVNQQINGGTWVDLGQFNFTAAGGATITIRTDGLPTTITVSADAIRIVPVDALSITAVSPTSGPTAGGTVVTLTGTGFDAGATVTVGGIAATGVTIVNATTITMTTPAVSVGSASITVTSGGATYTRAGAFVVTGAGGPPPNSAPSITVPSAPATLSTTEDVAQTLTVTGTDPDAGQTLTWTISSSPSKGAVTGTGTGTSRTLTYTPNANANGADSFTIQVADGAGGTATRAVTVSITAVNDPPVNTAIPTISGTLEVGAVLTATSGTWTDAKDANPGVITYAYQWRRANSSAGSGLSSITGATTSTYTLNNSDLGKFIDVLVTATDAGTPGTATASSASARTAAIAATANTPPVITAPAAPATLTTLEDTAQTVQVTATDVDAGQTLTWTISASPSKGAITGTGTGLTRTLTYTPNLNANGADAFTIQVSDGAGGTATRPVTVSITAVNDPPVNTAAPAISGTLQVGLDLSATSGTWTDAKDANPGVITYAYQWRRADNAGGSNVTAISGATNATYTLTNSELAKYIDVVVTATDSGTPGTAMASSISARTAAITAPTPNSPPVITAPASPATLATLEDTAQTVTVTATDADSGQTLTWTVSANPTKGTVSGTGTGATVQLTYTPNDEANGADSFTVQVSDGFASSTRAVTVTITPVNDPPVNTAPPIISGIPEFNRTLSATTGTWTDAKDANPGPITYGFQWRKADTIDGTNVVNIAGATTSSFTLTTNEYGKFIDVLITATDSGNPGTASATSAAARTMGVSTIGGGTGEAAAGGGGGGGCGFGGGLGVLGLLAAGTALSRGRRRAKT